MSLANLAPLVQEEVAAQLQAADVPGANIAVWQAGAPALTLAVGLRDPNTGAPAQTTDHYYLYSVTKTVVAALILQLAHSGQLVLDAPIASLLAYPDLPPTITVRQLLGHTSGLADYGPLPAYKAALRAHPTVPWTAEETLAATLPLGLLFTPDSDFAYSNVGYLLLRLLLEQLTGQPFGALVAERLVQPLGLSQTSVVTTLAEAAHLAPGWSQYLEPTAPRRDIHQQYHPGWVLHGVIVSTATEAAQIIDSIVAGDFLNPASRALLLTPRLLPISHPPLHQPGYGLGVMLDAGSPYGLVAGHTGGGPGYASAVYHFPLLAGQPTTIAVLANADHDTIALDLCVAVADCLNRSAV